MLNAVWFLGTSPRMLLIRLFLPSLPFCVPPALPFVLSGGFSCSLFPLLEKCQRAIGLREGSEDPWFFPRGCQLLFHLCSTSSAFPSQSCAAALALPHSEPPHSALRLLVHFGALTSRVFVCQLCSFSLCLELGFAADRRFCRVSVILSIQFSLPRRPVIPFSFPRGWILHRGCVRVAFSELQATDERSSPHTSVFVLFQFYRVFGSVPESHPARRDLAL